MYWEMGSDEGPSQFTEWEVATSETAYSSQFEIGDLKPAFYKLKRMSTWVKERRRGVCV